MNKIVEVNTIEELLEIYGHQPDYPDALAMMGPAALLERASPSETVYVVRATNEKSTPRNSSREL